MSFVLFSALVEGGFVGRVPELPLIDLGNGLTKIRPNRGTEFFVLLRIVPRDSLPAAAGVGPTGQTGCAVVLLPPATRAVIVVPLMTR